MQRLRDPVFGRGRAGLALNFGDGRLLSSGLIVSGLLSPIVGRRIDRHGGNAVLA